MFTIPDIIILVILSFLFIFLLISRKPKSNENKDDFKEILTKSLSDTKLEIIEKNNEYQNKINKDILDFKQNVKEELFGINNSLIKNINELNEKVNLSLKGGFKDTNETFNQIKEKVTKIDVAQKNIETLSKEVVSLQNVLTNNQARGQFGEYQLNNMLSSLYGENNRLYKTQYTLSNGTRADAVIFISSPINLICIDSKFPYSSFSKLVDEHIDKENEAIYLQQLKNDLKKHINDIHNKYIIRGETAPFAWMFIPSDSLLSLIHYKLNDIISYANKNNVSIVSPTLLLPLLTSYKVLNINLEQTKNAQIIKQQLISLEPDVNGLTERWNTLQKQLDTLNSTANNVNIKVNKISRKFNDINNLEE